MINMLAGSTSACDVGLAVVICRVPPFQLPHQDFGFILLLISSSTASQIQSFCAPRASRMEAVNRNSVLGLVHEGMGASRPGSEHVGYPPTTSMTNKCAQK